MKLTRMNNRTVFYPNRQHQYSLMTLWHGMITEIEAKPNGWMATPFKGKEDNKDLKELGKKTSPGQ